MGNWDKDHQKWGLIRWWFCRFLASPRLLLLVGHVFATNTWAVNVYHIVHDISWLSYVIAYYNYNITSYSIKSYQIVRILVSNVNVYHGVDTDIHEQTAVKKKNTHFLRRKTDKKTSIQKQHRRAGPPQGDGPKNKWSSSGNPLCCLVD